MQDPIVKCEFHCRLYYHEIFGTSLIRFWRSSSFLLGHMYIALDALLKSATKVAWPFEGTCSPEVITCHIGKE